MPENTPKRKAKDSVFTDIFKDKHNLLKMYQALHPEDLSTTVNDLTDITINYVLADGIYNDLGFKANGNLIILVESQSTWSENILIRSFLYLAKTYQDYCFKHKIDLYASKKAALPTPELYVIYTKERFPNAPRTISLKKNFFGNNKICLDAKIKVIYKNKSDTIINQYITFCMVLDEQIKKYGPVKKAIEETIKICQNMNVLNEYLEAHKQEVINIMDILFNQDVVTELRIANKIKETEAELAKAKEENKKLKEKLLKLTGQVAVL